MNAKRINAAAGVVLAAMKQRQTAAGIAMALEAACLLQSPETAAGRERLRLAWSSARRGRALERAASGLDRAVREAYAAQTRDLAAEVKRLRARVAELEAAPVAVWRASHDSIPMGLYRTAEAAREHCEDMVRCEHPSGVELVMEWCVDEDDLRVSELDAQVDGRLQATGYYVTALTVQAVYDPDGPEDHGVDEDPVPVALTDAAAEALAERRSWEDPHDSPLHHDHALGQDLPEPGVTP